ncbi:beta-lactamase/transpeptidase-like protein [Cylindrobasidium torrendii FP15055 ss-10]|uniref:Beta-lactamase/transpeptidase-like protein n=1 Tax=Cylindrobasidium torrendii FP15055 ss-10 TaxID=1314674 RepID=A0A0D7B2Z0_9AGAR|nr:beta-lactamase/transpeptidase-like protein [Cylindrobasidium torrendii FP15055 ss-10]
MRTVTSKSVGIKLQHHALDSASLASNFNLSIRLFSGIKMFSFASLVFSTFIATSFSTARARPLSQQDTGSLLTPDIDAYIIATLAEVGTPGGLSIAAVVHNDDGSWAIETKGYGNATLDGTPVDEDTMFAIGSNTKLFTVAVTGLLLANESLPTLTLDTPLSDAFPEWKLMDSNASSKATLTDLFSHRTGVPGHNFMYELNDQLPDIISRLQFLKPSAPFQSAFQYSNLMYATISYLSEIYLGVPYAHYVKEHILNPLGLSATFSRTVASDGHVLAQGFSYPALGETTPEPIEFYAGNVTEDGGAISGAGGLIMNSKDAATWIQTLLLDGASPTTGEQVIPADILEFAATGRSVVYETPVRTLYGAGQQVYDYQGYKVIEHGGGVPGFTSQIMRVPELGVGLAILTNDFVNGIKIISKVQSKLMADFIGSDSGLDNSTTSNSGGSSTSNPAPTDPTAPSGDVASYAGTYTDPAYGSLDLCYIADETSCLDTLSEIPASVLAAFSSSSGNSTSSGSETPNIFIANWGKMFASHFILQHYDADSWNMTLFSVLNRVDVKGQSTGEKFVQLAGAASATFVVENSSVAGFGITGGLWGSGETAVAGEPIGDDIPSSSEVWFSKSA